MLARITYHKALKKTGKLTKHLCTAFSDKGLSYRAAFLAYATLLAIVPLLIISIRVMAFFPIFDGIDTQLQSLIVNNFVAQSANTISAHLQLFISHIHKLSTINLVFLVLIDILMIYNINQAFNAIWEKTHHVYLSLSFLIYFLVLLLSPLLFGGVLVLASLVYKLSYVQALFNTPFISTIVPYFISLMTFTLFNWILPWCRVGLRAAFYGGLITTVIFESAKAGFAFYLSHASTYRLVYGAMAVLPLFLIWLYVSWLIILLGALITKTIKTGIPTQEQTP